MKLDLSKTTALTPPQWTLWEETLTAFSWNASAFTHCLYDLCNPDKGRVVATFLDDAFTPEWFLGATNAKRVFLSPTRVLEELDLMERIFLLGHEVCHVVMGHIVASAYYRQLGHILIGFKKMAWSDKLANMAQDYVINDLLINCRIGKFIKSGLHDPTIGTYKDSWIDVYERLLIEQKSKSKILDPDGKPMQMPTSGVGDKSGEPDDGKSDGKPTRNNQKSLDTHLGFGEGEPVPGSEDGDKLGSDERVTQETMERETQRAQRAAAAAMELAKSQGKLPAALQIFCEKILEPVITWQDHIKSMLARRLGSGGYDFRRPDRRLLTRDIIVPGRSGHGANLVVIGGDSSGSIYGVPELTARWMGECGGIMEDVKPREVRVVWCDAKVQRVDICTDMRDVHKMLFDGVPGGGGTDFRPVFDYIDKEGLDPDCLVYLTDGDGTFPQHHPRYPVIWVDISGDAKKYPFGDVVHIPVPTQVNGRYV